MEENLEKVFQLVQVTPSQIILKVTADDPLTVALYPFVSSDMAYITVTRGDEHTLTVTKKDGKTWSFHWGNSGYTLISENGERLKKAVIEYIQDYQHILLGWVDCKINEATIYYNNNFRKWQLTLEGRNNGKYVKAYWWSDTAHDMEEMATEVIPFIKAKGWAYKQAVTGIDTWKAVL